MAAPGIVTLTINPALDISTSVKEMLPYTKMRCAPPNRDPGGGGINVARVLKRLGLEATAVYPAGGATGQTLAALLDGEGVPGIVIPTRNDTREDITIYDETSREQFRLVFPGGALSELEWKQCLDAIARLAPQAAFVIASGSLPPGVPADFYGRVVEAAKGTAKLIVDTSGASLRSVLEAGVYLIKPNLHEFQDLAGESSAEEAALIAAGRGLFERYRIEVIALSMGAAGALLMTRDVAFRANGFAIQPASVSGAGDSFLAAMVWSLCRDSSFENALRYGVAGGSAALFNPGTGLCRATDVHRLASEVMVRPVSGDHG
jgi:6-phosphofructokinase 2